MSARRVPFNVNDSVLVRVKDWSAYDAHYGKYGSDPGRMKSFLQTDDDGYTKFQLWEFMHIFGPATHMGPPPPYETEIVLLLEDNHPGGGSRPVPAPSGSRAPGPGATRKRPFAVHECRDGTFRVYAPNGDYWPFADEIEAEIRCRGLNDIYEAGYNAGHRDAEPCDGCGAAEGVGCSPWCEFHPDKVHPRQGEA